MTRYGARSLWSPSWNPSWKQIRTVAVATGVCYLLVQCAERGGPVEVIRAGISEFQAGHRAAVAERARVARAQELRDALSRDSVARAAAQDHR